MERNPNENVNTGSSGQSGSASGSMSGSGGYGASTGGTGGSFGSESYGSSASTEPEGKFEKGKEAVTEKLGKAREKASELKASLADKLEAGAEKLRHRGQTGTYAGATGSGTTAVESDDRMTAVSNKVAGGLQHTADWIRDADVDALKTGIERQVKEHPGRTLLIAAGVGYLLGKAFRR